MTSRILNSIIALLVLAVAVLATVLFVSPSSPDDRVSNAVILAHADAIVAACAEEYHRPSCYDREIPKLMDEISMEDSFRVTRIVQEKDPEYQYCHVLGHELSAREVRKDPDAWQEVIGRCPSGMCSNGCLHGGFQERFRSDMLSLDERERVIEDLTTACEARSGWHPTGLEQGSCYHALGHLTMYITDADIDEALNICERIAKKEDGRDLSPLCYDGAFMQMFQPLEPEDFVLIEGKRPTRETVGAFCARHTGQRAASCISESWPLFYRELSGTPAYVHEFCGQLDASLRPGCYTDIFYMMAAQLNLDSARIGEYCAAVPGETQGQCFANAASRFIETDYRNIDAAGALCAEADARGHGAQCWDELVFYAGFAFHPDSEGAARLCALLPDPWRERCTAQ